MRASISVQARASSLGPCGCRPARGPGARGEQRRRAAAPAAAPRAPARRRASSQFQRFAGDQDLRIDFGIEREDFGDRHAGPVGDRGQGVAALDDVGLGLRPRRVSVLRLSSVPLPWLASMSRRRQRERRPTTTTTTTAADQGDGGEDPGYGAGAFFHWTGRESNRAPLIVLPARASSSGRFLPNGGPQALRRGGGIGIGGDAARGGDQRRGGPGAKAAPSSSGLPPWAPTPGMRKIERGISSRRRAMWRGLGGADDRAHAAQPACARRGARRARRRGRRGARAAGRSRRRQVLRRRRRPGLLVRTRAKTPAPASAAAATSGSSASRAEQRVGGEGVGAEARRPAPTASASRRPAPARRRRR